MFTFWGKSCTRRRRRTFSPFQVAAADVKNLFNETEREREIEWNKERQKGSWRQKDWLRERYKDWVREREREREREGEKDWVRMKERGKEEKGHKSLSILANKLWGVTLLQIFE